jgi:hypothetical protein
VIIGIPDLASFSPQMNTWAVELLSVITPRLKRAAIIFNPDTAPASTYIPSFETATGHLTSSCEHAREDIHADISALQSR